MSPIKYEVPTMEQSKREETKRGRKLGFRKPDADTLKVNKGIRFTEAEHNGITKARGITGESETEFMRDAIGSKVKKTLKVFKDLIKNRGTDG